MPQFISTRQMVQHELTKLRKITDVNNVLRVLALESQDMVSNRIQKLGKNADDQKMVTKSPRKYGSYSYAYGKYKRSEKGFQTAHIDFTYDGSLWSSWQVLPISNTQMGVGFVGDSIRISQYLEEMFGDVFTLTAEEEADILELATHTVDKLLQ